MIAGGSPVARHLANAMIQENRNWTIKLIDPDYDSANKLASELKDVMVLHGDPTDLNLMITEGLLETDVFISVSEDEESNIISCLMAKHLKVKKKVAMVSKSDYIPLSQTIGLDAAVNKKLSAANEIHRHVPAENYASLPETGKWILSLLMMIGRLEVFTVLVLLSPAFWKS